MEDLKQSHRLTRLFDKVPQGILSVYFTAGFPELQDTAKIVRLLASSGVDMVEIGIPYSDPVADGPTIQSSNHIALQNGMNLKLLISQLESLREKIDIPIILMGYINPILQYGLKQFCEDCQSRGVDGLIIPDLPMQEYLDHYRETFNTYGLHNIFLITPQTSPQRIAWIDRHSESFIYAVSDASITGATNEISADQKAYFERLRDLNLRHPFLIGFGIYDHQSFAEACQYARGAIIGSAFINALSQSSNLGSTIKQFVNSIKSLSL